MIEFNQDKYKLNRCLNYFKVERIIVVFAVIFFMLLTVSTVSAQVNNTPAGIDVEVAFDEVGVNLTFANVTKPGQTNVDISTEGPSIPAEYNMLGNYYDISTSADHVGNISVCIKYNYFGADDDNNIRILHYEDIGDEAYAYMQENISEGDTIWNLTAADYPDVFCCEGSQQSLDFVIDGPELEINDSNFVYRTLAYERDGLPFIVWLGENFNIVDNKTNNWYLSDLIVNENSNDAHLLTTGEPLSLPEGFAVTVLEIDIEGGKAWISVSKDGEELYSSVRGEGEEFIYMEDLNESSNKDNWVLKFNIETVFSGMNSNIVKINGLKLRSPDVVIIETPNNDLLDGFIITEFGTTGLQIKLDTGERIKLKKGGVVDFISEMFRFKLDADGDVGGILKNTNPQGIWKDVTCSLDTNPICGLVTDLSEFVVVELIQNNNTPAGIDVEVPFDEVGVNLTFANVTKPGQTNVDISTEGPSIPAEYNMLGNYYDISTSADHVGNISVCIKYNYFGADDDNNFRILHYEDIGDEAYASLSHP